MFHRSLTSHQKNPGLIPLDIYPWIYCINPQSLQSCCKDLHMKKKSDVDLTDDA